LMMYPIHIDESRNIRVDSCTAIMFLCTFL
jgi:hypothetical protein